MLDKEGRNIDAVIVGCPDHMHGTAAIWPMERGKHVYVEKPLTRTVAEARMLTEAAAKYGVATQMGNQEIPPPEPVPSTTAWNLWLGIAAYRPYTSGGEAHTKNFSRTYGNTISQGLYLPFNWRGFFDFGTGPLGDMACHILGAPHMALRLAAPTSGECLKKEGVSPIQFPKKTVTRFQFPSRGGLGGRNASGAPSNMLWWPQCEVIKASAHYAILRGRSDVWPYYQQTLDFVKKTFLDDKLGGWFEGYIPGSPCEALGERAYIKGAVDGPELSPYHMISMFHDLWRITSPN